MAARVQVLSGPVGVDRDLSDLMSEIAVGMVEKSTLKDSDIVQRHEALVNTRIAESLIAGEYGPSNRGPMAHVAARGRGASYASGPVRDVPRVVSRQSCAIDSRVRRNAFVCVERENPAIPCCADCRLRCAQCRRCDAKHPASLLRLTVRHRSIASATMTSPAHFTGRAQLRGSFSLNVGMTTEIATCGASVRRVSQP
jgi:hypothetical protein